MAINGSKGSCGGCAHFPLKEALEAGGHGLCQMYRKARRYDWPATVLYSPASDTRQRRGMIDKFIATQPKEEPDGS